MKAPRHALVLLVLALARAVAGETATAVATVTGGTVSGVTVTSGGGGYTREPIVSITGGGGSGATARAVLGGDKVAAVEVVSAGSGYTSPPGVVIEAPAPALELALGFAGLATRLTLHGPPASFASVEWAGALTGPWTTWSHVMLGAEGVAWLDGNQGSTQAFYRAIATSQPPGPAGFAWIPPGTFVMGSPDSEPDRVSNEVQHTVTLTRGLWLSDHEVTQGEYQALMGTNPSSFKGDPNLPVETVSWTDAVLYCQKLTERERAEGRITAKEAYRLPTESEWEYAARAGTTGPRHGELDAIAWYGGNSGGQPRPVKQKAPNAWGLHDMIGNVREWCADWYAAYPTENVTDPLGPVSGSVRVVRGGASFSLAARLARSAKRDASPPGNRFASLGFRPALSPVW